MRLHRRAVVLRQPVQRRAQTDGFQDRRRAGLEPMRRLGVCDPVLLDPFDHLPAPLIGRQGLQRLGLAIQGADAGGAEQLVACDHIEVAADGLNIGRRMDRALAAVDQHLRANRMGQSRDLGDRIDRPQHVRHVGDRDHARPRPQQVGIGRHVQRAVVLDRRPFQHRPVPLAQEMPRHDVGVVLHLGDDDLVARLDRQAQPMSHQIDRLGPALGPDDLFRGFRIQEPRHDLARLFESLGRLVRQGVQAAVDVGVAALHRRHQGVDYRARLLRRGRVVQIDQRFAVHLPRQDRELRPHGVGIEGVHNRAVSHSRATSLAPSCSIRSMTSIRKACVSRARASSAGMPRCCM